MLNSHHHIKCTGRRDEGGQKKYTQIWKHLDHRVEMRILPFK